MAQFIQLTPMYGSPDHKELINVESIERIAHGHTGIQVTFRSGGMETYRETMAFMEELLYLPLRRAAE